jgi:hypothetical protein
MSAGARSTTTYDVIRRRFRLVRVGRAFTVVVAATPPAASD